MNYFFFAHLIFYRKPVVVCISDIRIQTNVHHDNDRPNQFPNRRTTEDNLTLPTFASLAKVIFMLGNPRCRKA
jgi:hypothetical protein